MREATEPVEAILFSAQAVLDRLHTSTEGSGACILFAGIDGVPIRWYGQRGDADDLRQWGLCPGVDWSEQAGGTNGIGTCLVERTPLTVHREQHFYTRDIDISCAVAPIFDHAGLVAGALDISLYGTAATGIFSSFALAVVSEAARQIEIDHFHHKFPTARIVSLPDRQRSGTGLLAVDADDVVIGATRSARLTLKLTDKHLREGVSAMDLLGDREDGLANAERGAIRRALVRNKGNVSGVARALNVSRATMKRKLNLYGLKRKP
ncbi:GAF domain-containing protein [Mesorhizobium sp. M0019]|uniref:GAF domain-containing protein n=1 Tax=Mesorhizobium sp. M0019 TaxID=2956845 RepID=UPI003335ED87